MITASPITANLLVIDGLDISNVATYKVSENKEVKSSVTNMRHDLRQTVIGSRVTIEATITVSNRDTLTAIIAKLDLDSFDVTYFNARDNATRQAQFVCDGYDSELLFKDRGLYKPFTIQLTSVSVR